MDPTGGSQKIKTTNIDLETAVLKYIKEVPSQRTYPDPPILSHFCKKTNCSFFENFQKPVINVVSKNITNG
jgi:hypothetical protein